MDIPDRGDISNEILIGVIRVNDCIAGYLDKNIHGCSSDSVAGNRKTTGSLELFIHTAIVESEINCRLRKYRC